MNKLWRKFLAWLKKHTKPATSSDPQPDPAEPEPLPDQPQQIACSCDLTKPLCEPDRGSECPKPFGLDIRLLCWSPEEQDRVSIGYPEGSLTLNGKMLTANDFVKNGKAYTFRSHHQRSINAPALTERTVECKPCHKVVWEARLA